MIDLNRTHARAVADLKLFIEFARRGPLALAQEVRGSVGTYDSPLRKPLQMDCAVKAGKSFHKSGFPVFVLIWVLFIQTDQVIIWSELSVMALLTTVLQQHVIGIRFVA